MKNKVFVFTASFSILIVALSFIYTYSTKKRQATNVKGESVEASVVFSTPTLVPTSTPTPTFIPTNAPAPQSTSVTIPTPQPTAKPDNTSKIMAIKNLFEKIVRLNADIINASLSIEENKSYSGCSREELMKNPNLTPMAIESLMSQCLNIHYSLLDKIALTKGEISNINLQIQGIIATCDGAECNQLYQEFVSRMEAEGYVVR